MTSHTTKKAFTLIEMVVVMTIFAITMSITLASFGTFNKKSLVTNAAEDIALEIRLAQTLGSSGVGEVLTSPSTSSNKTVTSIVFKREIINQKEKSKIIVIKDTDPFGQMFLGSSGTDEITRETELQGINLTSITAIDPNNLGNNPQILLPQTGSGEAVISFVRPSLSPRLFSCTNQNLNPLTGECFATIKIQVRAKSDPTLVATIVVTIAGQIYVE
jgi:prepilin-type N-terminal cleavage/methylation domain-containing protein